MNLLTGKRVVLVFYFILVPFILLLFRLCFIQVEKGDYYTAKVIRSETQTVPLEEFPRGDILDRNMCSLTGPVVSNRLIIFPLLISDPDLLSKELAAILKVDRDSLLTALSKDPCVLPYKITPSTAKVIRQMNWPGVLVLPVTQRYGAEPLAVQVVGHLGRIQTKEEISLKKNRDGFRLDDWVGRTGLELYYNSELMASAASGYARIYMDARSKFLKGLGIEVNYKHVDGGRVNLVTTIDSNIQRIVEKTMNGHIKNGAVVVMDVKTGDLLAMGSRPEYNPEPLKIEEYLKGNPEAFLDQCTMLFPPGSLFKIITACAALQNGCVAQDDYFYCGGIEEKPIRCWNGNGHGKISFSNAFAQSCNPVFVKVAQKLGPEKLIACARSFGLNNQKIIGYDKPYDKLQNLELIASPYNLANSSVGQGPVLATPVQISAMMNTIANDGVYMQPRLVRELRTNDGIIKSSFPVMEGSRTISLQAALELKKLLTLVTTEGIGREAYVNGYGSAGKTGTAELGEEGKGIYSWFCGYAPLDQPRFVVTVLVKEGIKDGQTAAPVFREIMGRILTQ
ncbi:MAG: Peptidoglycan glycosyltransferase [Desulfotomaculum sp. 46_296]|nr:MAG: Peptidoglycan glycosyltransferase [Desulfotomaculum sp. 46_296]HAU31092.1 peptidoglycan glycosyltransferase [Desulfotomaculum sp.]